MERSELVVIAGPNGAGKSTFFDLFLRETGLRFVNADSIARVIAPGELTEKAARAASRAAEAARGSLLEARESFCLETVFSDPVGAKVAFLEQARGAGYRVSLVFIGLGSVALSRARVIQRVASGGHDVPDEKLVARYPRILANLRRALPVVHDARIYDNSDAEAPYRLVARVEAGIVVESHPPRPRWLSGILPGRRARR